MLPFAPILRLHLVDCRRGRKGYDHPTGSGSLSSRWFLAFILRLSDCHWGQFADLHVAYLCLLLTTLRRLPGSEPSCPFALWGAVFVLFDQQLLYPAGGLSLAVSPASCDSCLDSWGIEHWQRQRSVLCKDFFLRLPNESP